MSYFWEEGIVHIAKEEEGVGVFGPGLLVFCHHLGGNVACHDYLVAVDLHIEHWKVDEMECVCALHYETVETGLVSVANFACLKTISQGIEGKDKNEPRLLSRRLGGMLRPWVIEILWLWARDSWLRLLERISPGLLGVQDVS